MKEAKLTQLVVVFGRERRGAELGEHGGGALERIHDLVCIEASLHLHELHLDHVEGLGEDLGGVVHGCEPALSRGWSSGSGSCESEGAGGKKRTGRVAIWQRNRWALLCCARLDWICAHARSTLENARALSLSLSGSRATTALVSVSGLPPLFVLSTGRPRRESVLRWSIFEKLRCYVAPEFPRITQVEIFPRHTFSLQSHSGAQ